jgi:hypothetical protein
MDLSAISFEEIQRLINNAVIKFPSGRPLRKAQIVVLQGFWEDMQYEEMSKRSGYKVDYLRNKVASSLCQLLTEVFGQEVTKRNPIENRSAYDCFRNTTNSESILR